MARRLRSSRSLRSGRPRLSGLVLFLLGVLVGVGGVYLGCRDSTERPPEPTPVATGARHAAPPPRPQEPARSPEAAEAAAPELDEEPLARPHPDIPPERVEGVLVALVIDDLGRDLADLDALARLEVPLTYSVLPFEEQTPEVVEELRRRGVEILCHLPMEPSNGEDPGPGALRSGMTDEQLESSTAAALAAVPGAVGVNNHMGSGLSTDERSMDAILGVLSARGLFFLDSRTSPHSVGYRLASSRGIPAAERQVFLDNDPAPAAIREQFARLLGLARTRGSAIAIGHPYPTTLEALAAEVPKARDLGYEFVPVSYLLDRTDGPEE